MTARYGGTYQGPPQASLRQSAMDSLGPNPMMEEVDDESMGFGSDNDTEQRFRTLSNRVSRAARNSSTTDVVFARTDFEDLRATVQQLGVQMNAIGDALRQVLGADATSTIPVTLDLPIANSHKKPAVDRKTKKQKVTPDVVYSAEVYPYDSPNRSQTRIPKLIKSISPLRVRQSRKQEKLTKQLKDAYATGDLPVFEVRKYVSGAKPGHFGSRAIGIRRSSLSSSSGSDSSNYGPGHYGGGFDKILEPRGTDLDGSFEIVQEAGTLLYIYSPHITGAIVAIAGSFPGIARNCQPLMVPEPFCALLYFRDKLLLWEPVDQAYQDSHRMGNGDRDSDTKDLDTQSSEDEMQTREDAISHMKILYSFVDDQYLSDMLREKERWEREIPVCTFKWLWLLFPPQELVYEGWTTNTIEMQAYQVKSFSLEGPFKYDDDDKPIVNPKRLRLGDKSQGHFIKRVNIRVTYRIHDGRNATLKTKLFVVYPFKGEKCIHDLEIYPARFLKDPGGNTRNRLIQRGRRYQSLASRGQFDYHGETFSGVRRRLDTRIIVDLETCFYARKATNTQPMTRQEMPLFDSQSRPLEETIIVDRDYEDSLSEDPYRRNGRISNRWRGRASKTFQSTAKPKTLKLSVTEELTDEQYIICPPTIQAYILSLGSVSHIFFDLCQITEAKFSPR
jgi:hypothetical protein